MNVRSDLALAYMIGFDDAVAKRKPDSSRAGVLNSYNCTNDCTNSERTGTCLPHFWTHDGALHVELPKLPESISVRLPDQRDREVRSARTWQFTRDSGTCHNASKVMDEHGQARFVCSECGAWIDSRMLWNPEYRNGESPWVSGCKLNFCPNCGRKVVSE